MHIQQNGRFRSAWAEHDRLAALASCGILDTPPEREYDQIVDTVRRVVGVPMAAITLVDRERVWVKAEAGLGVTEGARAGSVCSTALHAQGLFVCKDLSADIDLADSYLVNYGIRFYAGAPIVTEEGLSLGMICALGDRPRDSGLTIEQASLLETMAALVSSKLRLRRMLKETTEALNAEIAQRQRAEALEAEAETLRSELLHLSRASAMGTMASTLAHELNQPLTAIRNYAAGSQRLIADGADVLEMQPPLLAIQKNAARIGEIINSVRCMLKNGHVKQEKFCLDEVIKDAVTVASLGMFGPIEIRLDLEKNILAMGDPIQIQQVIINFVKNACEATSLQTERDVAVFSKFSAKLVVVGVEDNGPGIPDDQLADLFKAFATTKASGMGLGLSICRTIIEAHHGKIWAENRPAGGARFCFSLPIL